MPLRVAIGFYGITRSLKYTLDSIKKNIFNVLSDKQISYEVFMHTYSLSSYTNKRTREKNDNIDNDEYKLLNADYVEIDNQDEIKLKLEMKSYRTHPDPWGTGYNSVDNFILGQYSKWRLTNMIEQQTQNGKTYDFIFFVRPDCRYLVPFDVKYLELVNDSTVIIPNFHLYGIYKINDRFCVANPCTYKICGGIFPLLLGFSTKMKLHSETIIGRVLSENNIAVRRVKFHFARIRCNGGTKDFSGKYGT